MLSYGQKTNLMNGKKNWGFDMENFMAILS
jgi:hypothetical protein